MDLNFGFTIPLPWFPPIGTAIGIGPNFGIQAGNGVLIYPYVGVGISVPPGISGSGMIGLGGKPNEGLFWYGNYGRKPGYGGQVSYNWDGGGWSGQGGLSTPGYGGGVGWVFPPFNALQMIKLMADLAVMGIGLPA